MALISPSTVLADAILDFPGIVPVINRFGIFLGTGDATVADACAAANVSTEFFLIILNTFVNDEYFPERTLRSYSGERLVHYLEQANRHYCDFSFPNIERHFLSLVRVSGTDSNVQQIYSFFQGVKEQVILSHESDMSTWVPALLSLERGDGVVPAVASHVPDSSAVNDAVSDLVAMFVRMLSGSVEPNLAYAVLTSLSNLARDVRQNNRIRDRILVPLYLELVSNQNAD